MWIIATIQNETEQCLINLASAHKITQDPDDYLNSRIYWDHANTSYTTIKTPLEAIRQNIGA